MKERLEQARAAWHKTKEHLHTIYILFAVGGVLVTAFNAKDSTVETALAWGIALYLTVVFIAFALFAYSLGRKARYAEATRFIHQAIHQARDAYHYLEACFREDREQHFDKARLKATLEASLSSACQAFTLVSGTACRMSIKILGLDQDVVAAQGTAAGFYVSTLARDSTSAAACAEMDRNEAKRHRIMLNTDFRQIALNSSAFYFNGNIPTSAPDYENSRCDGANGAQINLTYKSTIVWPVRYRLTAEELEQLRDNRAPEQGELRDQTLYAFLTVDSGATNAFEERYDVQLGAALADALFPLFSMYRQVKLKTDGLH